jgi:hypothetical protein
MTDWNFKEHLWTTCVFIQAYKTTHNKIFLIFRKPAYVDVATDHIFNFLELNIYIYNFV